MDNDVVDKAIAEARRFIEAAMAAKRRWAEDKYARPRASKEGGALQRASLDLTRKLAEMRGNK